MGPTQLVRGSHKELRQWTDNELRSTPPPPELLVSPSPADGRQHHRICTQNVSRWMNML